MAVIRETRIAERSLQNRDGLLASFKPQIGGFHRCRIIPSAFQTKLDIFLVPKFPCNDLPLTSLRCDFCKLVAVQQVIREGMGTRSCPFGSIVVAIHKRDSSLLQCFHVLEEITPVVLTFLGIDFRPDHAVAHDIHSGAIGQLRKSIRIFPTEETLSRIDRKIGIRILTAIFWIGQYGKREKSLHLIAFICEMQSVITVLLYRHCQL